MGSTQMGKNDAKEEGFWKKIWNFIARDVQNANETKRAAVIMRVFALLMCAYFLIQGLALLLCREEISAAISIFCLLGNALAFYLTYKDRTRAVLRYMVISMTLWIIFYVILYGWECGVQLFMFVLLLFAFITSHTSAKQKICFAVLMCAVRMAIFSYTRIATPIIQLSASAEMFLQTINTIAIFVLTTAITILFCNDSLAMEKKLVIYNERLKDASRRDPLTKLYNRRAMTEYMEQMVERLDRYGNWFNVAIGDIDFFKKVNDTYGHEAGDLVLVQIAELLSAYMKSRGCVGRWGGEEFLLIFKDLNGEEAYIELEKIRSMVQRKKIVYNDQVISVTMTFGLEEYSYNKPVDYTINNADQKLYLGKNQGRNRVIF